MTQVYTRTLISPPLERSYVQEQSKVMLPELQHFNTHTSQCSDRQSEGNSWRSRQPPSPMSDTKRELYEVVPAKPGNMYQARPEATQKGTREQLPSLSSLFASTSHQGRPLQSPYSESRSPVFPLPSPVDTRHPATTIHPPEPSYDASYFQRPPVARGYSYNSRPEQVEKLGIQPPPPPRVPLPGNGPESPRHNTGYVLDSSRPQGPPTSAHGWSPRLPSARPEYFSRDTSSSFRTHSDLQISSTHRPESDSRPVYREVNHNTSVAPVYPPTPASTVAGDGATKDGLGPKIWTGTQFLPRFVRQADVPGEGMCYFYDDGTHCKTVIDGEVVNAHWGVTKAGKPRKRLAIACITCREKKIKCDPDYPRCVQCEKFGRICKFKNAPRGGQGSPDTPPAEPEDVSRPGSSRADVESFKVEKRESSRSVSPRQPLHATPESDLHHSKRQRTGYAGYSPVASEASPRLSVQGAASPSTPWTEPLNNMLLDQSNVIREWHTNPYRTNPTLVSELVAVFFKHVPETAYCIFPEAPFKAWILSATEKSLDDLMLIYTVLAIGTVFSLKAEHKSFGPQFAAVSRYACNNRKFTIQLVQSRLLLALYFFANNNPNDAWDFCGAALRAASGLRLNVEVEKSEDAYLKTFPYGLNRAGYAECRRRTFWSCYLMDRFNGFCSGHLSVLYPEDVFLRLPCDINSFESQADVQNPFFDAANPSIHNSNWTIGPMAYLINIATIWGDVMANVYRGSQRPGPPPSPATFPQFYENTSRRLRAWNDSLPSCYIFSAENVMRAASNGMLSTFITMHAVYHTTTMKLNRYIQHSTLTTGQLTHHQSVARHHAEALLTIMDTLASRRIPSQGPGSRGESFSSPFVGYAIVSAVDILTARFAISNIPSRLSTFNGSESVLAELALFWQSSKNQQTLVLRRIRDLAEISASGIGEQGGAGGMGFKFSNMGDLARDGTFMMRDTIEKTFSREWDCVYV